MQFTATNRQDRTAYYLSARYDVPIDPMGRITLLAKWREQFPSAQLLVISNPAGYLGCRPCGDDIETTFAEMQERFNINRNPRDPSHVAIVSVDRAGRITLPEPIRKAIGLTTSATLIGAIDAIEIWEPKHHALRREWESLHMPEIWKLLD